MAVVLVFLLIVAPAAALFPWRGSGSRPTALRALAMLAAPATIVALSSSFQAVVYTPRPAWVGWTYLLAPAVPVALTALLITKAASRLWFWFCFMVGLLTTTLTAFFSFLGWMMVTGNWI